MGMGAARLAAASRTLARREAPRRPARSRRARRSGGRLGARDARTHATDNGAVLPGSAGSDALLRRLDPRRERQRGVANDTRRGARRAGDRARARPRPPAPAARRRRLQRPLEHRLGGRPPRGRRPRLRRRRGPRAAEAVLGASTPLAWSVVLRARCTSSALLSARRRRRFGAPRDASLGSRLQRPLAHLLFFALLVVFLGGSGIVHAAAAGTRYALVLHIALTRRARRRRGGGPRAGLPASARAVACALALLRGADALGARSRPRPATLPRGAGRPRAHHLGRGLVRRADRARLRVPRATADDATRQCVVARFSTGARIRVRARRSGLAPRADRARAVTQIWSTSYGRALLVKTALFVPLLGLGWLNRSRLLRRFARLRRSARVEVSALVGIVAAVAVLTELAPGRQASRRRSRPAPRRRSRRRCRRAAPSSTARARLARGRGSRVRRARRS